ncbi:MAG: serine/threonine-protein kinase [Tenacibaculum sp.]
MVETKNIDESFETQEILKKSEYSIIRKVKHKKRGTIYVIKEIKLSDDIPIPNYSQRVNHKNVVKCIDVFNCQKKNNKYICFVLEWLEGKTLRESLLAGEFEVTIDFLLQILEGLNYLHRHNIIHGDIKPDNIFVIKKNGFIYPKLIDYNSRIPKGDAVFVTPSYAPPEYIKKPTKQNDLWAIGCILYEILTNKRAFVIDSTNIWSEGKFNFPFNKIKSLPEPFRYICFKCLRHSSKERFSSTREIIKILENKKRFKLKIKMLRDYILLKK